MINKHSVIKVLKWIASIFVILLVILAILWGWFRNHSDRLWNIVSQECIPQALPANPSCLKVVLTPDAQRGYLVFKDRRGPLHFLLMPTTPIGGIESDTLLDATTTDYFQKAWQERTFIAQKSEQPVPRDIVSLTVNSSYGRSQDQLHIHISCIKPEVKAHLEAQLGRFSERWTPVEYGINNHEYIARTLTDSQFQQMSPFLRLAQEVPGADKQMGMYGLALVAYTSKNRVPMYLLLANKFDLLALDFGYTGDIQDYQCDLLKTADKL
ncbi:CDP-diacylglycerol diphosphatase [Budvicia diplopodorum]|uniref:CDP-diacylglycerol diphosphatase n=1 Tax=Budvicia diplopodorum TaxID=1119056 RepID=UPI0013594CCF|nr:CDP-diacylglycerol diphosphatase [Budvicia diplopodorum]